MSATIGHELARGAPRPAGHSQGSRPLRIALAGCGTVGAALAARVSAGVLAGERRMEVVKVLVRDSTRARAVSFRPGVLTDSLAAFLTAPADVVVEALGGIEPARTLIAAALVQGKRVVTANKALVAAEGAALAQLARRFGGTLDFEGAVGGGVPVVRVLRAGVAGIGVTEVRGVLNGTANFVLDRVAAGGQSLDAIREAQSLGFAEADPARDLDGRDAADKLAILAWLAFGVAPHMLPVSRRPLDDALALAVVARGHAAHAVQLAEVVSTGYGLVARVEPALIGAGHDLARATAECNAVTVQSASAGTMLFAGRGAGGEPTAGALIGDLGATSTPLPSPRAVLVASHDERVLRWVLWGPSAVTLRGQIARATPDVELMLDDADSPLVGVSATSAVAVELREALRRTGVEVALARDLR